jgi:peptidoglycan-associated lipoprotein
MRMSLVSGLVVVGCVSLFGSGCTTLHDWWYGPEKTSGASGAALPPESVALSPVGATLAPDEFGKAELGKPFEGNRTVDASAVFAPVHFAYDSFVLPPREVSKIDQVGKFLQENSGRVVTVDGHCDERGSNEYNLSLGEQRAQSVRTYLINLGVDASRIQTRSFGKEKPLDPGHSESAWAKNRRGEFVIYK